MDRDVNNTNNNVNLSSNIGFLNVCGLRRRSLFPEFSELVSKYDLFFVAETKMDSTDLVNINGYDFLSKPRQQAYIRRSGGLGLFVKHDLCNVFAEPRRQYLQKYYYTRSNMLKYKELMSLQSPAKLIKLSSFIRILLNHFSRGNQ